MRILIGTHHYPPDYVAGVELLTERLARWMRGHGHEVELVTIQRADAPTPLSVCTEIQDGITVHRLQLQLDQRERFGLRYRDDVVGDWFERLLRRVQPDVYHSQSSYLLTGSLIEAAQRA